MTLALSGASYRYAGTPHDVLADITLEVAPGRVVGLVGPNEAGKSTLCLVASGLAPASIGGSLEGSVTIDGVETRSLKPHQLAQRCGVLFQNPATQLSGTAVTVYEEVAFGPRNLGLPIAEIVNRVEWALATLDIEALAPKDPARLSGGQAQLVALASVLTLRPAYLVLDEPTSQLDPQGTRLVGGALAHLAAETGTGILVVEHKTELLAALADQVAVLDGGRIVVSGPAGAMLGDPRLPRLGVEPPDEVRLRRALSAAGLDAEAVLPARTLNRVPAVIRKDGGPAGPAGAIDRPGSGDGRA
ncbi:MAG: energy-coupling factor ABC transporter ATP-binding protein [Candidatus Limnocylindrales bacterium]